MTRQRNPWLDIPEADYVGHMASPDVGQHSVLRRLFGEALVRVRPNAVLLLGCATGNGLDLVDPAVTRRVTGVDINPAFLRSLEERFPRPPFVLDLHCADLTDYRPPPEAFDLVHAALLFEYLDWPRLLPRLEKTLRPGGVLSVVLQLPSDAIPAVTPTAYTSLRRLEPLFHFVDPRQLLEAGMALGLTPEVRKTEPLPTGKAFEVLQWRKGN